MSVGKWVIAVFGLLVASMTCAQSYTCPEKPAWDAVPCSMHRAITAEDGEGFYVTKSLNRRNHQEFVVTAGASTVTLHIYKGHFENPDWVARRIARAWAAQPAILRRSVMPLIIGVDHGAGGGAVFWDMTDDPVGSHVIEYPAAYVHEYANTLDWAFEEALTHELCHVLDTTRTGGRHSRSSDWFKAVVEDRNFVSDYARSRNIEDFAESCAAHALLAIGGDRLSAAHRDHVLATMSNRSAYFNKLFMLGLQGSSDQVRASLRHMDMPSNSAALSGAAGKRRLDRSFPKSPLS